MDDLIIVRMNRRGNPVVSVPCPSCGKRVETTLARANAGRDKFCDVHRRKRAAESVRFWAKVDKDGPTPAHCAELGPCWLWMGALDRKGYGVFRLGGGRRRNRNANRAAWEIAHGPIPEGLWALHKCDNPRCVNPSHLFLGTHLDNMADMARKGRARAFGRTTKLTDDMVREIRRLHAAGIAMSRIGEQFSVDPTHVRSIVLRKARKHVE